MWKNVKRIINDYWMDSYASQLTKNELVSLKVVKGVLATGTNPNPMLNKPHEMHKTVSIPFDQECETAFHANERSELA